MRGRAFTIIEIMVVVLLATAISAVLIPTLVGRVTGSKLDGAASAIRFGAALAAAEAKRNGEITVFVAEQDGEEWVLYAEPIEPERIVTVFAQDPLEMLPEEGAEEDMPRRKRVEVASFDGVEIREEPLVALLPSEESDGASAEELFGVVPGEEGGEEDLGLGFGAGEAPRRWVFGVFFADGTARPGPTLYLSADDGRRQRSVRVRPLTGTVQIDPVDPFGEAPVEDIDEGLTAPPVPGGDLPGGGP
ncbi:MAG: type II secretion system protein [Phycisphaerales bacterium JB041]